MPHPRSNPVSEQEMEMNSNNGVFREREPIDEKEMNITRYQGHHTICQTLRDTYHMTEDPEIRLKLRLAMAMAKAMVKKLKEYKAKEAK